MPPIPDSEFQEIINFFNKFSKVVGLNITGDEFFKFPRNIYRWFVGIIIMSVFFCMYPYLNDHWGDLPLVAQCNVHIIIVAQSFIKLILFVLNRSKVTVLLKTAREFRVTKVRTDNEYNIAMDWTKKSNFVPRALLVLYIGTIPTTMMMPFINHADSLLPYAVQLPFVPPNESPFFEINYIYQLIALFLTIMNAAVVDCLFAFCLQEACLQLDVIQEKLTHVGEQVNDEEPINKEEHLRILHEIHVDHVNANQFVYDISDAFGKMLMVQFIESTLGVTFTLINVTEATEFDFGMFNVLISFCFQLFLWSWFGEQTRTRMETSLSSMYNNYWYNLNLSSRKSLSIMMSCSQKQYSLSAGGLIDLSLPTFVTIIRTAYSYYAVMKDTSSS